MKWLRKFLSALYDFFIEFELKIQESVVESQRTSIVPDYLKDKESIPFLEPAHDNVQDDEDGRDTLPMIDREWMFTKHELETDAGELIAEIERRR